jgi:phospholipase/carboxylesterase
MMARDLSFIHRFEPATRPGVAPLLLLHGTGGDENDLLPLGGMISPGAALLSVRGQVLENGMPRFFRRLAEGVFDEADVIRRANDLADFVEVAREVYGLPAPLALGYSNGANIAASMLLLRPRTLQGGILLRAMVPLAQPPEVNLSGRSLLLVAGQHDPIIPEANGERLAAMLTRAGADVTRRVLPVGHQLSQSDINLAREWLKREEATADIEQVLQGRSQ